MATVIAGSRSITDAETVYDAIESAPFEVKEVVSGTAEGVDTLAEKWAEENSVPVTEFPYEEYLDEASHPKQAPLIRNEAMAEYAEQAVIVWDGESSGTEDMLNHAQDNGLEVHLVRTDTQSGLDNWL